MRLSTSMTFQTLSIYPKSLHSTLILYLEPPPLLTSNWGKARVVGLKFKNRTRN